MNTYKFTASKSDITFYASSLFAAALRVKELIASVGRVLIGQTFKSKLGEVKCVADAAWTKGNSFSPTPMVDISCFNAGQIQPCKHFAFPLPNYI